MRADDNLQYAFDELRVMAHAVRDGNDIADELFLERVAEAIWIFAEENRFHLENPYPEEE